MTTFEEIYDLLVAKIEYRILFEPLAFDLGETHFEYAIKHAASGIQVNTWKISPRASHLEEIFVFPVDKCPDIILDNVGKTIIQPMEE